MHRLLTFFTLFIGLALLSNSFAVGQDVRQRRRAMMENLLKTLIDSQLEKNQGPQDRGPGGPGVGRPGPGNPGLGKGPGRVPSPTAQMIRTRKLLAKMAEESENLIYDLRNHEIKHPQVRPLLADAIRIRASVDVLMRRCSVLQDVAPLRQDFLAIDRDWRVLRFRLQQFESITPECRQCVKRFHAHQEQLCTALEIEPQFNRRELARLVTSLSSEMDHLVRDVYYELRGLPAQPAIIKQGQNLQAQIRQYGPLINHGNYDEIVAAFKQCMGGWRKFNRELCNYPNDRIRHGVGEIEDAGRQIHELLWLPVELDREYFNHLCTTINTDVDRVFKQISLADLMNCKVPGAVLTCSREFRKKCQGFGTRISSKGAMDDLRWDYRAFDNQWRDLNEHCRGFGRADLNRSLDEIEYQMGILRSSFGTETLINHHQLLNMCSEMDQWVHELDTAIHQIQGGNYGGTIYRDMCGCCDRLQETCHALHTQVLASRKVNDYRLQLDACFKEWARLKTFMNQCNEKDRRRLARYRSQIEPLMVKLQVIYSE